MLPSGENVIFKESSFFSKGHGSLPRPEDVRRLGNTDPWATPTPVSFPALNLLVKYSPRITFAEGQCIWAIQHFLPSVPVPEIYGWCRNQGQIFLYVQLIDGITLADAWPDLVVEEKYEICVQLDRILGDLRQLKQDLADLFIGSINGHHIGDIILESKHSTVTFNDVSSFHDWFANLSRPPGQDPKAFPDHGSRYPTGMPKVMALIDWHQSGWYPASWEFYKTRYTAKATPRGTDMWEIDFILEFLDSYRGGISFERFVMSLGG
ncbi:hypothetical protein N431DRAFT_482290 [Stipitochalara longipes BDJ]|nr:hypothetical protein N431DRAFT_482290 [Stipitochalara longipes BDJ]